MLNNDLYKEMEKKYGKNKMILFSEMVSEMYSYLYLDRMLNDPVDASPEYDFERDWWRSKHDQLVKTNEFN